MKCTQQHGKALTGVCKEENAGNKINQYPKH